MQKSIVWEGIAYDTEEHCSVNYLDGGIVVRSEIEGWADNKAIYAEYTLYLSNDWTVTEIDIHFTVGADENKYSFKRTPAGWIDSTGGDCAEFGECRFVDISLTPLTNTLPIKGLLFGESQLLEIEVVYFDILANEIRRDVQHYAHIGNNTYRFTNAGGDYTAEITVDADGFVTHYPELFEMLIPH